MRQDARRDTHQSGTDVGDLRRRRERVNTADPAAVTDDDLAVAILGDARYDSPMAAALHLRASSAHYVDETDRVLLDDTVALAAARALPTDQLPSLEPGGPRRRLFFDPAHTRVGIVTCGGLCPGLNNVIRALVLELTERYGVTGILGFPDGYRGLVPGNPRRPVVLTADSVNDIHSAGGTILGTSRGNQDAGGMVDTLQALGICILFVIGGDGTLRGAQKIADAAAARRYDLAVVGVPKTIDNDIPLMDHSFGFQTAFARAAESIRAAHTEASSTPGGVGLVKLMGRHSGFIACYAALANHDTDFVLIPEVPFALDGPRGVLRHLRDRVAERGHAVVVVAEGAGQDLLTDHESGRDASGNTRLGDIGPLLSARIRTHFAEVGAELNLRYIDPGYAIRSVPANPYDGVFCIRLAQAAVHAAMAGRTAMVVGRWHGRFVHVPISLATASRNVVDADGDLWMSVLEVTGQPAHFT
jgi:6-phosphofructokinase 1